MKSIIILLGVLLCFTTTAFAVSSTVPTVPTSVSGYTGYSLNSVKSATSLLNPFTSYATSVVVNAINAKQFAASSYSFFMRHCFRKSATGGYQLLYYYRAYDHTNPTGKEYYGTMTVFWPAVTGYSAKFISYTVDAAVQRSAS